MSEPGCFGIHLGNSFASIAISKDGKFDVLANEAGDYVTPAIFSLQDDETTVVGLAAKHQIVRNAGACVINAKMLLNAPQDNWENLKIFSCSELEATNSGFVYQLRRDELEKTVKYETVLLEILLNLNSIANHAVSGDQGHGAVLSVPLDFTQEARKKLAQIVNNAGFEVLQIISDPAAAALAYNIKGKSPENVLIYRLGGLSKDVTILRAENGLYEILGNLHEKTGCNAIDKLLVDYIAKEFHQKYKLDPHESRRTIAKLFQHAQNAKHVLSSMGSAHIFIESLMDGVDFSHNLSRARFENLLSVADILEPIKSLQASIGVDTVDKIILCGGGMRIPKYQSAIAALFPNAELLNSINPEEVIAVGCAKQAALLSKNWDPECQHLSMKVESLPYDILLKVGDEEVLVVDNGTLAPVEKPFIVDKNGETKFIICERDLESKVTEIGEITLDLEGSEELNLKIDSNGVQIVKAA